MKRKCLPSVALTLMLCGAGAVHPSTAATRAWTGTVGDWPLGTNWAPSGVPASTDDVVVANGSADTPSSVTITGAHWAARLFLGSGVLPPQTNFSFPNTANQDPDSWGYYFPGDTSSMPAFAGSHNTLVVSGTQANLNVSGIALVGYRGLGDTNSLIIENGATVSMAWVKQAINWGGGPQSNTHNQTIVQSGATLILTAPGPDPQSPYGEFSLSNFGSGDLIVDDGTIRAAHFLTGWNGVQPGAAFIMPNLLFRGGLLDVKGLGSGYGSGTVRIGDGKGATMELRMGGGKSCFYGGHKTHSLRDPDDVGQGFYPRDISLVVKSDGILSGSASHLVSTEWSATSGYLIEGGTVSPGDEATNGTISIGSGWMGFEPDSTLEIDLFSDTACDVLTGSSETNYSDFWFPVIDLSQRNSIYISEGARLVVRAPTGYLPPGGQTWTVMRWNPGYRNSSLDPTFASNVIHHGAGLGNFTLVNDTGLPVSRLTQVYDDDAGTLTLSVHYVYTLIGVR